MAGLSVFDIMEMQDLRTDNVLHTGKSSGKKQPGRRGGVKARTRGGVGRTSKGKRSRQEKEVQHLNGSRGVSDGEHRDSNRGPAKMKRKKVSIRAVDAASEREAMMKTHVEISPISSSKYSSSSVQAKSTRRSSFYDLFDRSSSDDAEGGGGAASRQSQKRHYGRRPSHSEDDTASNEKRKKSLLLAKAGRREEEERRRRRKRRRKRKPMKKRRKKKKKKRKKKSRRTRDSSSSSSNYSSSSSSSWSSSSSISSSDNDDDDDYHSHITSSAHTSSSSNTVGGYKSLFSMPREQRRREIARHKKAHALGVALPGPSSRDISYANAEELLKDIIWNDPEEEINDHADKSALPTKMKPQPSGPARPSSKSRKRRRDYASSDSDADTMNESRRVDDDYLSSSADEDDLWPKLDTDDIPPPHKLEFPPYNIQEGIYHKAFPYPPSDEDSDQDDSRQPVVDAAQKKQREKKNKKREKKKQNRIKRGWDYQPAPPEMGSGPTGTLVLYENIARWLRHYQRAGVRFLVEKFQLNEGGVLGDDMGMGKTVQVICFLCAIFGKTGEGRRDRRRLRARRRWSSSTGPTAKDNEKYPEGHRSPCLIVVPSTLVYQWEREIHRWGCFHVLTICSKRSGANENNQTGVNVRKHQGYRAASSSARKHRQKASEMSRGQVLQSALDGTCEVVVMSYSMFIKYMDLDGELGTKNDKIGLRKIKFCCTVFDEAHRLKSSTSKVVMCVRALQKTCPCKIALTGTPMQNDLKELWQFAETIIPGRFGDKKDFDSFYRQPILRSRERKCSQETMALGLKRQKMLQKLLNTMMLRRKKEKIAHQLPHKKEMVVFCNLTQLQIRTYRRILASPDFQLIARKEEPCDCGRKGMTRGKCCHSGGCEDDHGILWDAFHPGGMECEKCPNCLILPAMNKLHKCSNHLELLKPVLPNHARSAADVGHLTEEDQKYHIGAAFARMAFGEDLHHVGGIDEEVRFQNLMDTQNCGKMMTLMTLLKRWRRKRRKVLLFSQSTRTLDILQTVLTGKAMPCTRLDGKTKQADRLAMCDQFNEDSGWIVFLISTRAGGMGLNLTGASVVVIFDPSWNPAHDLQAMDRAYRIGQRKNVDVYRLVTKGGIEEMVYMRSYHKQAINDTTMEGNLFRKRQFRGVAGDNSNKGNLFGMANLMSLNPKGHCDGVLYNVSKSSSGGPSITSGNGEVLDIVTDRVDYAKSAKSFKKRIMKKKKTKRAPKSEKSSRSDRGDEVEDEDAGEYDIAALLGEDDSCDSDDDINGQHRRDQKKTVSKPDSDASDASEDEGMEVGVGDIVGMNELNNDAKERNDEKVAQMLYEEGLFKGETPELVSLTAGIEVNKMHQEGSINLRNASSSSSSSLTSRKVTSAIERSSSTCGDTGLESPETEDSYSWPFTPKNIEKSSPCNHQGNDQIKKDSGICNPSRTVTRKEDEPIKLKKGARAASLARKRSRRGVKIRRMRRRESLQQPSSENAIEDVWKKVEPHLRSIPRSVVLDMVHADIESKKLNINH